VRDLFVVNDARADPGYINTRDAPHEGAARSRANCEALWRDFEPYAGEHFLTEFPHHFHQRWFEMYLAVTLLRAGLEIQCPDGGAPDVRVQHRDGRVLWLEATAPTGGVEGNPDYVAYPPPRKPGEDPVAYAVPIERVIMRVSGALHAKAAKVRGYRERNIIAPEHQVLVAISVNLIPHGIYDAERYGLGATYGLGPQYVLFDRATGEAVDGGFQHRPELLRSSGSSVDVAPFLHPGLEQVTGALVSGTNSANCPESLGLDFMLFPNPRAAPAYTERQIPVGREWRLAPEGDGYTVVEVIEHSKAAARDGVVL